MFRGIIESVELISIMLLASSIYLCSCSYSLRPCFVRLSGGDSLRLNLSEDTPSSPEHSAVLSSEVERPFAGSPRRDVLLALFHHDCRFEDLSPASSYKAG